MDKSGMDQGGACRSLLAPPSLARRLLRNRGALGAFVCLAAWRLPASSGLGSIRMPMIASIAISC